MPPRQRKIFIAIPSYSQKLPLAVHHAIQNGVNELASRGYLVHTHSVGNDAIIARARNSLVAEFVERGFDDLLFLDDDLAPESGAFRRIMEHQVGDNIVGCLYPVRRDKEEYLLRWDATKETAQLDRDNGLLEVDSLPTGFMRFTRGCAMKMIQAYADREYLDDSRAPKSAWALFDCMFVPVPGERGRYWGEDFLFCNRARAIGIRIWCDPWVKFKHIGEKPFEGCFGTYKKREMLENQERLKRIHEVEEKAQKPIQEVSQANVERNKKLEAEKEVVDRKHDGTLPEGKQPVTMAPLVNGQGSPGELNPNIV